MPVGRVWLVGAGPGDPELLTLRGAAVLAEADVVVYDGLANVVLLDLAPAAAEKIYAGKKHSDHGAPLSQADIDQILVDRARRGLRVVRLKGGDPLVFGRGGEEADLLGAAGIPFEIVPGVSSFTAVPAYAGIPLTHRDVASTVIALATGHDADGQHGVDWASVAHADTLVLFMAVKTLADIARRLVEAGRAADTPVAVIRWGTTAAQRTVVGNLADIAARVEEVDLRPPALVIVGEVVRFRERLSWYEKRPLFGVRVLVPRQREQARGLARALLALGAEAEIHEVTRITPVDPRPLDEALARLPGYDWIVFQSAHAVDHALAALERAGRDARALAGVHIAAVGRVTAEALRRRGLLADLVPEAPGAAGLAAALLSRAPRARILLPRAEEGKDDVVRELSAAGAQVTAVTAYRTLPAPAAELGPLFARLRAGQLDVLTFFAPSQVSAICDPLGAAAAQILDRAALIAAIGGTTAEALRARGVRVDLVPAEPSAESLASELARSYTSKAPREVV